MAKPDAAELAKKKPYITNQVRKAFKFIISTLAATLSLNNIIIESIHEYNARLRWVPAHLGVLGNEQADCAAVEAAGISSVKEKWAL